MNRLMLVATLALAVVIASCTGGETTVTPAGSTGSTVAPDSADSAPTTLSDDRTNRPDNSTLPVVFDQPVSGLSDAQLDTFINGQELFNQVWVPAGSTEEGPQGLGPLFNASGCAVCHPSSGRRQVPPEGELIDVGLIIRVSEPGVDPVTTGPIPEPTVGDQLQDKATGDIEPEGRVFTNYVTQRGTFPDGTPFEILWPTVNIRQPTQGPLVPGVQFSARIGAQLIGTGLLEAIPEETILALADPNDANGDGISGRPNFVFDPKSEEIVLGRFGWKANVAELDIQVANAFHGDIGITSSLVPGGNCVASQTFCDDVAVDGPEISDADLADIIDYVRLLGVTEPRLEGNEPAQRGQEHFREFGCAACHTETLTTGPSDIEAISEQTIAPYTDLLLHDLGFDMGDDRPDFVATGNEWRTPPLWGLGLIPVENDRGFLHDGRARTLEEAVLWHGGEGSTSRANYIRADASEREELLEFLRAL